MIQRDIFSQSQELLSVHLKILAMPFWEAIASLFPSFDRDERPGTPQLALLSISVKKSYLTPILIQEPFPFVRGHVIRGKTTTVLDVISSKINWNDVLNVQYCRQEKGGWEDLLCWVHESIWPSVELIDVYKNGKKNKKLFFFLNTTAHPAGRSFFSSTTKTHENAFFW